MRFNVFTVVIYIYINIYVYIDRILYYCFTPENMNKTPNGFKGADIMIQSEQNETEHGRVILYGVYR